MLLPRRTLVAAIVLAATACSSLRVHPEDSGVAKVTKGVMRLPLFATTLGGSEVWFACVRNHPEQSEDECAGEVGGFYSMLLGGIGDACSAVADASAPTPAPALIPVAQPGD
jgi:hypothetical protein